MLSTEITQLISDLKEIRNTDNASVINRAISSIRSLNQDTKIMTEAYTDCATRLQQSALKNGKLEEQLNNPKHDASSINPLTFRRNAQGFILREDWNTIVHACKVIGNSIWDSPGCGMTEEGKDYLPADITRSPKEIQEALKVVNAYFRTTGATRAEMIEFIKANPGVKITHRLFDPSEYIYSKEDGNIYDENGYLFEDWYEDHDGIRIRDGDMWVIGWKLYINNT